MKLAALVILLFSLVTIALFPVMSGEDEGKVYYAIEINGVLCGYTELEETKMEEDGKIYKNEDVKIFIMLSLFGSEFNTKMNFISLVDPVTKKCIRMNGEIEQGKVKINIDIEIKDGKAVYRSTLGGGPKTIELGPDVLFGSDEVFKNLRKEFLENNASEASFDILEAMESEVQNSTFKKIGEEKVDAAGRTYNAIIVQQNNNKTGVTIKYWVAPGLDDYVKFETQNRKVYRTDHTVVDKIKVASMDGSILTKTNKAISDVQALSYMKLKVNIQPTGVNLKKEDLNVPGQKFEGTVKDNLIDGILEISHKKYSGENAPAFPPDYGKDELLKKYLIPSDRIQSDDPLLIKEAENITKEARDSWDAAKKLSKWVAEKIHYAIPGGGTARGAYDMRAGECGAHSMLLAAFCRAVGIPARVVFGGMYVPNKGGAFGQHAWNEIYMGSAGWIPVDATAFETDYIDAGHIRICEHIFAASSFNAKSIEILDYKLGSGDSEMASASDEAYASLLGKYTHPESGKSFEVLIKEGNLAVDIPGQMVLPFNEADEHGRHYCKLSNRLYIEFAKNGNDSADQMIFHELISMTRQPDTVTVGDEVPEKFKPYVGNYLFAQINAVFKVEFIENTLGVYDPTKKETIKLQHPDEYGVWLDEFSKNAVRFEKGSDGKVTALNVDASTKFERQ